MGGGVNRIIQNKTQHDKLNRLTFVQVEKKFMNSRNVRIPLLDACSDHVLSGSCFSIQWDSISLEVNTQFSLLQDKLASKYGD